MFQHSAGTVKIQSPLIFTRASGKERTLINARLCSTALGRRTIRRYLRTTEKLGWSAAEQEPMEELASKVWRELRPDPTPGFAAVDELLGPHREDICRWLSDRPDEPASTLVKVQELLSRRWMFVSYGSLHRFAVRERGFRAQATTVRMAEIAPGELAESGPWPIGVDLMTPRQKKSECATR